MSALVVDTHTLVWYIANDARLSQTAAAALDAVSVGGHAILVPTICLVELHYLIEKGRLPRTVLDRIEAALDDHDAPIIAAPLDRTVVDALAAVPRSSVPEMADRIIAATAKALGLPLVTRETRLVASEVETIW